MMLSLFAAIALLSADEEAECLERYRVTERSKEEALVALEQAYARLEEALDAWRAREADSSPPLPEVLAGKLLVMEPEFDRIKADAGEGAPAARRARRAMQDRIQEEFAEIFRQRGLTDEGLQGYLAHANARDVVGKVDDGGLAERIGECLGPFLDLEHHFHELWNTTLFARAAESREYRERYNEYIATGVELDRLRHPHRYQPGGERVRAGMAYVPGGRYVVGPNTGFERKKKKVTLRPFLIDQFEVTSGDYLLFVDAQPEDRRPTLLPRIWEPDESGEISPTEDQRDRPVAGVTWRQAAAYARWADKRLPTEDEWEIACRGAEGRRFPWGDTYREGHCNDAEFELQDTISVGRLPAGASPFQLFHMAGNVEEWTASHEDGEVISTLTSNIAPIVVRGGHFLSARDNVGGVFRWVAPGGSTREPYIGFRCAADLSSR